MSRQYLESIEQQGFIARCDRRKYRDGALGDYVVAIPNGGTTGGRRAIIAGARRKAEGLRKGFPDLQVVEAAAGYHGLFIEMKRRKEDGGKASDMSKEQWDWQGRLLSRGYQCVVSYGAADAWRIVCEYLSIKE